VVPKALAFHTYPKSIHLHSYNDRIGLMPMNPDMAVFFAWEQMSFCEKRSGFGYESEQERYANALYVCDT
jgi:hypothetical protein